MLLLSATLAVLAGASATPVHAAFVVTDATDPAKLRRGVSVGLVRISKVHVDPDRKRRSFNLYRWVDLKLVRMLYGRRPPADGLRRVPYAPRINSAWPVIKGTLKGRWFVMAWRGRHACGLGSTVAFDSQVHLPWQVSGPKDPWVEAIRRALRAIDQPNLAAQIRALERVFVQRSRPRLAYLADAALSRIRSDHARSPRRLLWLLRMVASRPPPIPRLQWPLLRTLSRFPLWSSRAAYRKAWRGKVPAKWAYPRFRRHVAAQVDRIARDPRPISGTPRARLIAPLRKRLQQGP